jgi:hypothetical protein
LSTEIISKNQSGFRKGFSTTDNIFIMHALVSIYFSLGKKLHCTFVDYRKPFDTLEKMLKHGKCYKIIYMYDNIKSCVLYNDKQSNCFSCMTGVRKEKTFPLLFSVFLNDLEDYFKRLAGCPLEIVKEILEANLHIFIEILVLLYANDIVIFSE